MLPSYQAVIRRATTHAERRMPLPDTPASAPSPQDSPLRDIPRERWLAIAQALRRSQDQSLTYFPDLAQVRTPTWYLQWAKDLEAYHPSHPHWNYLALGGLLVALVSLPERASFAEDIGPTLTILSPSITMAWSESVLPVFTSSSLPA